MDAAAGGAAALSVELAELSLDTVKVRGGTAAMVSHYKESQCSRVCGQDGLPNREQLILASQKMVAFRNLRNEIQAAIGHVSPRAAQALARLQRYLQHAFISTVERCYASCSHQCRPTSFVCCMQHLRQDPRHRFRGSHVYGGPGEELGQDGASLHLSITMVWWPHSSLPEAEIHCGLRQVVITARRDGRVTAKLERAFTKFCEQTQTPYLEAMQGFISSATDDLMEVARELVSLGLSLSFCGAG